MLHKGVIKDTGKECAWERLFFDLYFSDGKEPESSAQILP